MTIAQLLESENGPELIAAIDSVGDRIAGYNATPTLNGLIDVVEKFRQRVIELGCTTYPEQAVETNPTA